MSKKSFTQKDYVLSISFANYLKGMSWYGESSNGASKNVQQ